MKKPHLLFSLLILFSTTLIGQTTFTLKSNNLEGQITKDQEFNGHSCNGKNESPQLSWSNPPEGTKSFAITMYDPDAPTGSGWWHWFIFDIPSNVFELVANAGNINLNLAPKEAIQSLTDFGTRGYGGPCPPKGHGTHQYIITIYALKVDKLGLDENTKPVVVGYTILSNALAKASLVAYYQR